MDECNGTLRAICFLGKINRETLHAALGAAIDAKALLAEVSVQKAAYDKEYNTFRKLLSASGKRTPLSEIIEFIDKIIVDTGKWIVIKWKTDYKL